jgi:protein TonB
MRRVRDLGFLGFGLVVHGGVAFALLGTSAPARRSPVVLEVVVKKPPPITPSQPLPPLPVPPPVKKVVVRSRSVPTTTPPPNRPAPPEPPKVAARPVFGVTMDSTTGDSSFSVPVGNTTMTAPTSRGPANAPLPAATAAQSQPAYHPASVLEVKTLPEIDADACGRTIRYPDEAERLGIEGDVKLRVALDDRGHVHQASVLSGLGHGLDRAAVQALEHDCKFSPARGSDGKPVAFVIESYTFHFELPR